VQEFNVKNAAANYQFAIDNGAENSPQVKELEEKINQAMLKKQTDEANLLRYEKLIKTNAVSQLEYDNVKLTYQNDLSNIVQLQKNLENLKSTLELNKVNAWNQLKVQQENNQYYNLTADGEGTVLQIMKRNGDLVKRGETVAIIGRGTKIMKLFIDEDDIRKVQMNQTIYVSLNTDKDTPYEGYVSKIYPAFDNSSQSFIAEASFKKLPPVLKDGTQLQANIVVNKKEKALVVPIDYLLDENKVFLKDGHQTREVEIGIKTSEWVEITSGLKEGEEIELPKTR
jgi:multidrug efflux pump subunit AcrA (membrane-fusion protein)